MTDTTTPAAPTNDPKKAATWFKKAVDCEKTRQWDYALTSYLMGLQFDLDNLDMHKKLIQVGKTRKANGGKAGGGIFGESFTIKGKTPQVAFLNAIESLAKDPDNATKWENAMKASGKAAAPKAAEWYGDEFMRLVRAESAGSGKKTRLTALMYHYEALEIFAKAQLAAEEAARLDPNNLELTTKIKNLAAQGVTKKGNYENATGDGSNFTDSIKDFDKQKKMLLDNADVKSDEHISLRIKEAREKWQKEPNNTGLLRAFINALLKKESDETENEAIKLLEDTFKKTTEYQLRIQAGDIRMRQQQRKLRDFRAKMADPALPADKKAAMQAKYDEATKQVLAAEIKEYQERSAKYPTDREMRFELGRRCLEAGQLDDAIDNLQQAESAPKLRIRALNHLGTAFIQKEWFEEATDSFRRAIEAYEGIESDEASLNLHYNLAIALEGLGKPEEALKEFSFVARFKLTFKDVRDRLNKIRNAKKAAEPPKA